MIQVNREKRTLRIHDSSTSADVIRQRSIVLYLYYVSLYAAESPYPLMMICIKYETGARGTPIALREERQQVAAILYYSTESLEV